MYCCVFFPGIKAPVLSSTQPKFPGQVYACTEEMAMYLQRRPQWALENWEIQTVFECWCHSIPLLHLRFHPHLRIGVIMLKVVFYWETTLINPLSTTRTTLRKALDCCNLRTLADIIHWWTVLPFVHEKCGVSAVHSTQGEVMSKSTSITSQVSSPGDNLVIISQSPVTVKCLLSYTRIQTLCFQKSLECDTTAFQRFI